MPAVAELLRAMHAETQSAALVERRMLEFLAGVHRVGAVLVSRDGAGRIVATCGLMPDAPWFSDDLIVRDVWLFVSRDARRAAHCRALIRMARRYAQALCVPLVIEIAGGARASRTAAKVRLFGLELGRPTGATWMVG